MFRSYLGCFIILSHETNICRVDLLLGFTLKIPSNLHFLLLIWLLWCESVVSHIGAIRNDVAQFLAVVAKANLIFTSFLFTLSLPLRLLNLLILWNILRTFFTSWESSSSSSCSNFSSSLEMIVVALNVILFFVYDALSSPTFCSISWFFKFPMSPMKSISALSFSSFNVVDLTSQEWWRAQITLLTFWSLSMGSPKEKKTISYKTGNNIINGFILIQTKFLILRIQ